MAEEGTYGGDATQLFYVYVPIYTSYLAGRHIRPLVHPLGPTASSQNLRMSVYLSDYVRPLLASCSETRSQIEVLGQEGATPSRFWMMCDVVVLPD